MALILGGVECTDLIINGVACDIGHVNSAGVFSATREYTITVPAQAGTGSWTARYDGGNYLPVNVSSNKFKMFITGILDASLLSVKYDRDAYSYSQTTNQWVDTYVTPGYTVKLDGSPATYSSIGVHAFVKRVEYIAGPGIKTGISIKNNTDTGQVKGFNTYASMYACDNIRSFDNSHLKVFVPVTTVATANPPPVNITPLSVLPV